ncbi:MAG: hypothetical protein JJT76_20060 [Clostridiaceae bacterium]|nr:hypothetical protein [Clostridiaceae bacterium]
MIRSKKPYTKGIAILLFIITIILSCNIYFAYKDYYFTNFFPERSASYIVLADSSPLMSTVDREENEIPLIDIIETKEANKIKSEENILFSLLSLLLMFISLATLQNTICKLETTRENVSSSTTTSHRQKSLSGKSHSLTTLKEGAK